MLNTKNSIWKISAGDHPLKKFPSNHDHLVTRYAGAGRVQTIKNIFSQNRIDNFVVIILDRFPINKTQK
jgi:hypothetical protein